VKRSRFRVTIEVFARIVRPARSGLVSVRVSNRVDADRCVYYYWNTVTVPAWVDNPSAEYFLRRTVYVGHRAEPRIR